MYLGLIEKYRHCLPVTDNTPVVSLHEGNTPLIQLKRLPQLWGVDLELWVKFEGLNPTGSFKDRGMTLALSKAKESGSAAVICASTGNTSASAAAYAARAEMKSFVLIPEGKVALGKLAQAQIHGATVLQIAGNFDHGMRLVSQLAQRLPLTIVNSLNPFRLQGQKTAAFEIVEALGRAPDFHALPVGNAGNITAHWMGYSEASGQGTRACAWCQGQCPFVQEPLITHRPRMLGYQATGSAPFIHGAPVAKPETVATAIRIGDPVSWQAAWAAVSDSNGRFGAVSDEHLLAMQQQLAASEGLFCEPASAISVAGVLADAAAGLIPAGALVVCTLTGHGLKDPDTAMAQSPAVLSVGDDAAELEQAITRVLA